MEVDLFFLPRRAASALPPFPEFLSKLAAGYARFWVRPLFEEKHELAKPTSQKLSNMVLLWRLICSPSPVAPRPL
ncbi:MAG: hypothetical protein IKB34_03700, partial [Clostridia bacterium]|nr:hypothetical protein [Clostridia bacterium]